MHNSSSVPTTKSQSGKIDCRCSLTALALNKHLFAARVLCQAP